MPKKVIQEVELEHYGAIGRYRVRLVESEIGRRLDVREYIESAKYTGWTKKGIRLDRTTAAELVQIIGQALKAGL